MKESAPAKWRGYLLGVWQRRQKQLPELRELYDSKLILAQTLLQQWVQAHPDCQLPVTFDNWFTQPAFWRFLDQTLGLPCVGTRSRQKEHEKQNWHRPASRHRPNRSQPEAQRGRGQQRL